MKRLIKAGNVINLIEELGKELNQICDNLDLNVDIDSTINEVEEYLQEEKVATYKRKFVKKAGIVQDIEDKISEIEGLMPNDTRANFLIKSLENLIDKIKQKIETKYSDYIEKFDININNVEDIKILEFIDEVEGLNSSLLSVIQDMDKSELEKRIDIYQKYKGERELKNHLDNFIKFCIQEDISKLTNCHDYKDILILYTWELLQANGYKYYVIYDHENGYYPAPYYYHNFDELKEIVLAEQYRQIWYAHDDKQLADECWENGKNCNDINSLNKCLEKYKNELFQVCGLANFNKHREFFNDKYAISDDGSILDEIDYLSF